MNYRTLRLSFPATFIYNLNESSAFMAGQGQRGPLGHENGPAYIDDGTSCRQRMLPPVPVGVPGVPGIPDYYCGKVGPDPITVLDRDPRIHSVALALDRSRPVFEAQLKQVFSGLDISPVLEALWDTIKKAALILGGSALLGAAIGAIAGGGVGALPGAGVGLSAGVVVMNLLGLGELISEIPDRVEAITGPYRRGFLLAWNAPDNPARQEETIDEAAAHFGAGHVVLALAVLGAIITIATRGKGKRIKEILERSRLKEVADWLERHKAELKKKMEAHKSRIGPGAAGGGGSSGSNSGSHASRQATKAAPHSPEGEGAGGGAATGSGSTGPARSWNYGGHKSAQKWKSQMTKRGWTEQEVDQAISSGKQIPAPNNVSTASGATRYIHPTTGRSVVIDNVTKEILHVGGNGFRY